MRTESSIKNLIYAFGGKIVELLVKLVTRFVFVKILATEYLGLNGLFSNILSILSLVELGIGPALTYSLYKPLAHKDTKKIKALINLYKKLYNIIGIVILLLGISITPFLPYLINKMPNISNIYYIYILFVLNTSISYFYTYKRSLLEADQKRYISTIYVQIFNIILNISQIIVLLITHNYIMYLFIQIIMTLLVNVSISKKAEKIYPFMKEKNIEKVDKDTKKTITKNVFAMVFHRIGGVVVNGTDNIIISKYVGLSEVGLYSNYYMIITALKGILTQIFTSITASVGNLVAIESQEKAYNVFKKILFLNFWLYSFSTICLMCLFNDFITLWLGKEYLFSIQIVILIVANFYVTGMRKTVLTFRDALGLYWQDRYKPIFESVINLVVSIMLVKYIGIVGVFIGTFVSTITTCSWVEPYMLFKYGFKKSSKEYFSLITFYAILTIILTITMYSLLTSLFNQITIITLIIKAVLCIIIPNMVFCTLFYKTDEFIYYKNLLINIIKKLVIKRKNKIR